LCECWLETGVAFARVGRASTETAIAFAGEKWVFFVRFSVAEVLWVSTVAAQGRALVLAVSCWPTSVPAVVSLVSKSARGCVLCAKKFAPHAQNGRKTLFSGALGELFRGNAAGGAALGELFRG
jgi:hypothetical protein